MKIRNSFTGPLGAGLGLALAPSALYVQPSQGAWGNQCRYWYGLCKSGNTCSYHGGQGSCVGCTCEVAVVGGGESSGSSGGSYYYAN
jgi:hypothetical protein